ncbi:hypothetical protein [Streptomyces coffeae]|uniref:Uncharacterized protein n=1 Tax=Streptomyces coffeae TaxID=621382 RepID=A0ABS1NAU3_9ACTN|nr:hypothetical protein [Streptomyces coffeae]MBL1097201.1 hypothetical protein [Streptomyces coffeae]
MALGVALILASFIGLAVVVTDLLPQSRADRAKFTSAFVQGNTLYGIADADYPDYDFVEDEGLWLSRDGGRTWFRFPGDGDG